MDISAAQADIRRAYVGGGPGAIVSAIVWLIAGFVVQNSGIAAGFATLFFGGMTIFPLGKLIVKYGFGAPPETEGNSLGLVALESTIAMIGCLGAGWLFLLYAPQLAFPVAAIAIGTHYFAFRTAYGDWTYWVLGGIITALGCVEILAGDPLGAGMIFAVSAVEAIFGVLLVMRAKRAPSAQR